jgi:hypothetical protein
MKERGWKLRHENLLKLPFPYCQVAVLNNGKTNYPLEPGGYVPANGLGLWIAENRVRSEQFGQIGISPARILQCK